MLDQQLTENSADELQCSLNGLADLPIWAARGAPKTMTSGNGRPVSHRAPINPRTGRLAANNQPTTWAPRAQAEKRAAIFPAERQPGVGLMLGGQCAPHGFVRAGIDLDGCRDPETGWTKGWADDIVWRFKTYTEASPSGTGLHLIFHVAEDDVEALRAEGLLTNLGTTFSQGEHVEIAVFFGGKFLTVTDDVHEDMLVECDAIRPVGLADLKWLLGEYGPSWATPDTNMSASKTDESGSGYGFRLALDLMGEGLDDDAVREALGEDEGEAGEWWNRTDDRQRRRAIENARAKVAADTAGLLAQFGDLDEVLGDGEAEMEGKRSLIDAMNARHAFTYMGASGVVADFEGGRIEFRNVAAFKEMLGNKKVGRKRLGHWWLEHPNRRSYDRGVVFDPSGRVPANALNLWQGFAVEPDPEADCGLIVDYVREVVAAGDPAHAEYVFTWLADIVQNPARKPGVALVLRGLKGVGKDTLAEIMRRIVGKVHTAHVTNSVRLADRFNAQFATALLAHFEEASWGGDRQGKGVLQSLITSAQMPLERKGVDVVQVDSFLRLIFTANDDWVVPATADERRYAVFEVPAHRKDDTLYWDALYAQINGPGLAGFLAFLMAWEVPEGVDVRRPPQTRGLAAQKLAGLRNVDLWWYRLLCEGRLPGFQFDDDEEDDWTQSSQVVSKSTLRDSYESWLRDQRWQGEPLAPPAFGKALRHLCPEIEEIRPRNAAGSQTKCYRIPPLAISRDAFAAALNAQSRDLGWDDGDV